MRARAAALGFDVLKVSAPGPLSPADDRLRRFVADGHHGAMTWMAETLDRRADPRALWPDVRSVLVLGFNYGPEDDPAATLGRPEVGTVSVYARNRDYHDVLKGRLKEIADLLARETQADVKVFVDTAPVMEKPLAQKAGVGWQGKHTNLVSRDLGSWLFLGTIFSAAALVPDAPETDHCGSCRACLDACPTDAFPAPYRLDARRCISYLTIEHPGPIPAAFRAPMGNRIYGCDDCLDACPWNKFAVVAREAKLQARDDLKAPRLADLLVLDDAGFRARFSGSPIKRIGRDRFLRNVLIAAGNSGLPALAAAVAALVADPAPVVRGAAVWALARLAPNRLAALADPLRADPDPDVRAELEAALGQPETPVCKPASA
ncbi:tRNA epoxyqueuosine(34) reductase QueG [Mongoliimonas terrestris]|uniref:tRNA epoxyqueuosine(34) reductase QueG n=1 Tax=Mongoliimonas terrestris TaxID=1709001 RepID=UPI000A8F0005|nr:tRNA epoxyqueuosine(34) reductase QueG [Mongoliimonas terrestris]